MQILFDIRPIHIVIHVLIVLKINISENTTPMNDLVQVKTITTLRKSDILNPTEGNFSNEYLMALI